MVIKCKKKHPFLEGVVVVVGSHDLEGKCQMVFLWRKYATFIIWNQPLTQKSFQRRTGLYSLSISPKLLPATYITFSLQRDWALPGKLEMGLDLGFQSNWVMFYPSSKKCGPKTIMSIGPSPIIWTTRSTLVKCIRNCYSWWLPIWPWMKETPCTTDWEFLWYLIMLMCGLGSSGIANHMKQKPRNLHQPKDPQPHQTRLVLERR